LKKAATPEMVRDIRLYLDAHKWKGASAAIQKKYGLPHWVVSRIKSGKTYKKVSK
jgi:hypothetical protein